MPKKKTSVELINEMLNSKDNITETTKKEYQSKSSQIPFNIMVSQDIILKKIKDLYNNPNTRASILNIIIMTRKFKEEETDKLIKYRNEKLRKEIELERKEKLTDKGNTLPSLDYLKDKLKSMKGIPYIINYLLIHKGLRNKDINLIITNETPEGNDENYMEVKKTKVVLHINDYKTKKSGGKKLIDIKDKKFLKELNSMDFDEGDYFLSKKDGSKLSIIRFNEKIKPITIDSLGETNIFKILIKHYLENKEFDKIEQLSKSRGTSMDTIMKSYNVFNNK
jgi:hypothetical protein